MNSVDLQVETDSVSVQARPCIVAVIPAYNEERFIGSVVLRALRYVDAVLVVDDGSTDGTADTAAAAGATVICHGDNQGKGCALNTGFRRVCELDPRAIVLLDGDGQHRPEEIPIVIEPILRGEADVVAGSRYSQRHENVPRHRRVGHWAFTTLTNLASGIPLSDSQNGFRAFSARAVEAIAFSSKGFSVESEMQFLFRDLGLRVVEAPVTTLYQDKPKRNVFVHGLQVLNGVVRLVGQYRPLLFFGLPGGVVLFAGLAWGLWVVDVFRRNAALAVGYAMISVLLTMLGTLTLFTGVTLHSIRAMFRDNARLRGQHDRSR